MIAFLHLKTTLLRRDVELVLFCLPTFIPEYFQAASQRVTISVIETEKVLSLMDENGNEEIDLKYQVVQMRIVCPQNITNSLQNILTTKLNSLQKEVTDYKLQRIKTQDEVVRSNFDEAIENMKNNSEWFSSRKTLVNDLNVIGKKCADIDEFGNFNDSIE